MPTFDRQLAYLMRDLREIAAQARFSFVRCKDMVRRFNSTLFYDSPGRKEVQGTMLGDTDIDEQEHLQAYGLESRPVVGSGGLSFSVGADPSHRVACLINHKIAERPNLEEGEVCIWSMYEQRIKLVRDGDLAVTVDDGKFMHLGSYPAEDFVALAKKVDDNFQRIVDAIAAAKAMPQDGGLNLQTNILFSLGVSPVPGAPPPAPLTVNPIESVAAQKVKAS